MGSPLILAIDFGTQSVRAVLFDTDGQPVRRAAVTVREPDAPAPGWAEHDPDYLWHCLTAACREALGNGHAARIAGVALTALRSSVVAVDAAGEALRPAIMWPDRRQSEGVPAVGGITGLGFRVAGLAGTLGYFQREAEANWLAIHEPDIWARTAKYLMLSGYLCHRLTGEFADGAAAQIGYVPLDFRRRRWASPSSWKWRALPWLRSEQLPRLLLPGQRLGTVTGEAAVQTGIPAGVPLIAAAADKACEVLGCGALDPDIACLSYGTAATVNITSPKYVEPVRLIPPYPAATPDAWNLETQVSRGFWLVSWFKTQFGHPETRRAARLGVEAEPLMDELLGQSEPGANGLLAQPFWSPGLRTPGPEARGALVGFSSGHTRADVYRALLEGIVYALREGKERIEKRLGRPSRQIRVAGGGSRSDTVMQLTADMFGVPVARPKIVDTAALGAAINAAVGLGLHAGYADAVRAMTHTGDVFDPDGRRTERYDALYRKGYLQLYRRLNPVYRALHDIVGPGG